MMQEREPDKLSPWRGREEWRPHPWLRDQQLKADGMGKASFFVSFCLLFLKGIAAGKLTRLQ